MHADRSEAATPRSATALAGRHVKRGSATIALVGCGAIAQTFHLPALLAEPGVRERLILVDRDLARAQALGEGHGLSAYASDLDDVLGRIDAAVLAVPHHLHFVLAMRCLSSGVHVLCEKPLAENPDEVRKLVAASEQKGVVAAVNNTRRLFPSNRRIASMLAEGAIGRVRRIDFSHGEAFGWPVVSGANFGAQGGGKGVLLDVGAHILDLVCWWLGGKPDLVSYHDDSFGGSEAVCRLRARLHDCDVNIHLSWLSKLANVLRIQGESGQIEAGVFDYEGFILTYRSGTRRPVRTPGGPKTYSGFARHLIAAFMAAIQGDVAPLVSARDVLPSIALIAECYARRQRLDLPWFSTFGESICG